MELSIFCIAVLLGMILYYSFQYWREEKSVTVYFHEFDNKTKLIEHTHPEAVRRIPRDIIDGHAKISWTGFFDKEDRQIQFVRSRIYNRSEDVYRNWRSSEYERFYKVPKVVKLKLEAEWDRLNALDYDNRRKEYDDSLGRK